jgi:hypothetical protein
MTVASAEDCLTSLGYYLPSWPWGAQRISHGRDPHLRRGCPQDEDTQFYLRTRFRFVAIEAMSEFCESISNRFSEYVRSGALSIVNLAVLNSPGDIIFMSAIVSRKWGTTNQDWFKKQKSRRRCGAHVDETRCQISGCSEGARYPEILQRPLIEQHRRALVQEARPMVRITRQSMIRKSV